MTKAERTEIAFEIARVFLFGERWREAAAWCAACGCRVPMVLLPTAAALDKMTAAEVFWRVEAGELHYRVTAGGGLLICLGSLLEAGRTPSGPETST